MDDLQTQDDTQQEHGPRQRREQPGRPSQEIKHHEEFWQGPGCERDENEKQGYHYQRTTQLQNTLYANKAFDSRRLLAFPREDPVASLLTSQKCQMPGAGVRTIDTAETRNTQRNKLRESGARHALPFASDVVKLPRLWRRPRFTVLPRTVSETPRIYHLRIHLKTHQPTYVLYHIP